MIENIFRTIIGMSITASIIALLVYFIRITLGKYLPKNFSYYLWFIVLLRLIIPINFSSSLSLFNFMPKTTTIISRINRSMVLIPNTINEAITNNINTPTVDIMNTSTQTNPLQIIFMVSILWILGVAFLLIQNIIRYYKTSKTLETATIIKNHNIDELKGYIGLKRNVNIYGLDLLESPLVYGLIKPRIIVPTSMMEEVNIAKSNQILAHEMYHIKRMDNILKLLWSFAICIHWFNPIIWLSARFFNEDMELSCDEKVMGIWDEDIRKDYATSLINIAVNKNKVIHGSYIGFGKINIKTRLNNIINYKKPKAWISLAIIILLIAIMIFTLTNKKDQVVYKNLSLGFTLTMDVKQYNNYKIIEEKDIVYFLNKEVSEEYPENMIGTVFRIEAYNKDFYHESQLEEKTNIYNFKLIGENDKYYIGYAYPTDIQYPVDNIKLSKSYIKLVGKAPMIIETIELITPESSRFIENLKLAYEGRMDRVNAIIGENAEQYIVHPAMIGYQLGGLVISYDYTLLFTNGYFDEKDNNNPVVGDVVMISKTEAYGLESGMSMEEVEKILGAPDHIIDYSNEPAESELFGTNTTTYYTVGDYEVIIEYDRWGKTVNRIYLSGLKQNPGVPKAHDSKVDFFTLMPHEVQAYNKFIIDYDEEALRGLDPLSIMILYLHTVNEKNYEAEWELYTKEEDQLGWNKEYHMQIPDSDRMKNLSHFENPVNVKVIYDANDKTAVITWEDKYLEEYDGNGNPFRFGFSLVKNKDEIWKVAFLPMQ